MCDQSIYLVSKYLHHSKENPIFIHLAISFHTLPHPTISNPNLLSVCMHLLILLLFSLTKLYLTLCDSMDCSSPLSMAFPRQKYWSGLPFPSSEDLPNPRIKGFSLFT